MGWAERAGPLAGAPEGQAGATVPEDSVTSPAFGLAPSPALEPAPREHSADLQKRWAGLRLDQGPCPWEPTCGGLSSGCCCCSWRRSQVGLLEPLGPLLPSPGWVSTHTHPPSLESALSTHSLSHPHCQSCPQEAQTSSSWCPLLPWARPPRLGALMTAAETGAASGERDEVQRGRAPSTRGLRGQPSPPCWAQNC